MGLPTASVGRYARAGFDGAKKRKSFKVPVPVDTLGQLLVLKVPTTQVGVRLEVLQHHEAKWGFGLLPRRWAACFRRLARG